MDQQLTSDKKNDQDIIDRYNQLFEAKRELHRSMRRAVMSTKLGRQQKNLDDDIYSRSQ